MTLLIHILFALLSLAFATYSIFAPSRRKLHTVYGLTGATIVSGIFLGIEKHMSLVHACLSWSLYLGVIIVMIVAAKRKLALVIG